MRCSLDLFPAPCFDDAAPAPPCVVERVDLKRYIGTWYEIARYPNFSGVRRRHYRYLRAAPRRQDHGDRCREKDGARARPAARPADRATNAKLKVQFFWPFRGVYWVITELTPTTAGRWWAPRTASTLIRVALGTGNRRTTTSSAASPPRGTT